jgi:hypothetical protein
MTAGFQIQQRNKWNSSSSVGHFSSSLERWLNYEHFNLMDFSRQIIRNKSTAFRMQCGYKLRTFMYEKKQAQSKSFFFCKVLKNTIHECPVRVKGAKGRHAS